jgi:hypothetical protein
MKLLEFLGFFFKKIVGIMVILKFFGLAPKTTPRLRVFKTLSVLQVMKWKRNYLRWGHRFLRGGQVSGQWGSETL